MTDIGGGWYEHLDPNSGRNYYANATTQETRWEWPSEIPKKEEGGECAADWDERLDPSSGRTYYFNSKTQETSWTPPPGYKGREASAIETNAATDPTKWLSRLDESTHRTYYYNTVTKETTWNKPACLDEVEKSDESEDKGESPQESPEDDRTKAKGDDIETLTTGTVSAEEPIDELIAKYKDKNFRDFAEAHFQLHRKGMFKAKTDIDKILRWKSDVIKTALLNFKDTELAAEAVQTFRNITGYMGDRGSGKASSEHCIKLLNNMLQSPEELRNEAYCQLMKQLTENPSLDSLTKGWQLVTIFLATFPPGENLEPYLGGFCAKQLEAKEETTPPVIVEYAAFCLQKLQKINQLGARREMPTAVEIESTIRRELASVRVFFLDGKYVTIQVDAWTTAGRLASEVSCMLGVKTKAPFAIFEVSSEDEERVLDDDERVLDLIAYWNRLELEARSKNGKQSTLPIAGTSNKNNEDNIEVFHFQFKVRYFFQVPDNDEAAIELMYVQAKHDVVDARYPCSDQDAVTLAALGLQEEFGDCPDSECQYLAGNLGKYLSEKIITDRNDDSALEAQLLKLYAKLQGYSQQEARLSYLDYVKSWKIYGSAYFFAEPKQNRDFPNQVVLAINAKGILVVDPDTKAYIQEYPYGQIVTWGHSPNSFVVVTGNAVKQVKVYFKTEFGKEMNTMVRAYVQVLTTGSTA